jgi:hypothetical protein
MLYEFTWPRRKVTAYVATSDCKVVEADKSLSGFIGKDIYTLTEWAAQHYIKRNIVGPSTSIPKQ